MKAPRQKTHKKGNKGNKGNKGKRTVFRRWHRRIGLVASFFLLNLAITGIVLNHYEAFELDKHYIKSSWLLNWYGVEKPQDIFCTKPDFYSICEVGEFIFLSGISDKINDLSILANNSGRIVSLFKSDSEQILVTQKQVFLYTFDYQLIESLNITEQLSEIIQAATFNDRQLSINTDKYQWILDLDNFELAKSTELQNQSPINQNLGSRPEKIKESELKDQLGLAYQQRQITFLKFTQDIHSGQILSISGKLLADLAGLCLILLAISGFIMWKKKSNTGTKTNTIN